MFTGPSQCPQLAFNAAHPKTAGYHNGVHPGQGQLRAVGGFALVRGHPADIHMGVVGKTAVLNSFRDRQVGVVQVHVLTNQRHLNAVLR